MKKVNKTILYNISSTILLQGISFFTIPIFTRVLGTEQYGFFSVFNSWVLILTCIMGGGVGSALGTGRYKFEDHYYFFRSSIFLLGVCISGGIIGFMILLNHTFLPLFGYTLPLFILLLFTALGHFVVNFSQMVFIYEKRADLNFVLSVTLSGATVILSLILIFYSQADMKYMGRIIGIATPYMIAAILLFFCLFFKNPTGLHKEYCTYALLMGLPIVFHSLSQNILSQANRVMMQNMQISNTDIGIYSLFYSFTAVLSTILNALNNSWCPFYYDDLHSQNWGVLKDKCRNYIELFSVLTAGFLLVSREFTYFLANQEYWSGIPMIPILVLAVYFTFMYQFPVNFEFFHRKTHIIALGTCVAAVTNIILNLLLIPKFGMYGASIATVISYGLLFAAHYIIVTYVYDIQYHLKISVFFPGLMSVFIAILLFYLISDLWVLRWGMGILLGIYEILKIKRRKSIF